MTLLSRAEAKAALRQMRREPKPLSRPVVVAGGIHDPGFVAPHVARVLGSAITGSDSIISVAFVGPGARTLDTCRDRLIDAVQKTFGPTDGDVTAEVDVVGYSMGGIVARHAARQRTEGRRLGIRRLFTISTPHRGARLAALPTLDQRKIDMRPGSDFLAALDADLAAANYEVYSYARVGDLVVGTENTAPTGRNPWWVVGGPLVLSHLGAGHDPRILADIARRLRGEPPF